MKTLKGKLESVKKVVGKKFCTVPKKHILFLMCFFICSLLLAGLTFLFFLIRGLPQITELKDYKPPLTSVILDRNGEKIGEFFKERRILVPYEQFPKHLIEAFVAAEDGRFFEHKGLNFKAIFRAFLANLQAGRKVQGGSTITQQLARSLLLSSEKTYTRKLKEAILSMRMENRLSKEDILYLYLNQIYLGQGAYGVGMAAEIYFRKKVEDLNLVESSLLAGLTQAPSRFSPIYNSQRAKERQIYVLQRMVEEAYITSPEAQEAINTPLKVYLREKVQKKAPYYLETVRQMLVQKLGEEILMTGGLHIKTAMDFDAHLLARKYLQEGLKKIDKRQGYRGPLEKLSLEEDIQKFLEAEAENNEKKNKQFHILKTSLASDEQKKNPMENFLKNFLKGEVIKAVINAVKQEELEVLLPFNIKGVVSLENMIWALKSSAHQFQPDLKPTQVFNKGDVILVRITENELGKFSEKSLSSKPGLEFSLSLEQEPLVEGALVAFDQKTGDIIALVGGYDFNKSQFNRVYQAQRQTGSVFKPVVYLAALDKDYTPATVITDTPVVYNEEEAEEQELLAKPEPDSQDSIEEQKKWKPGNYSRNFSGYILFRNALIRSINVPTVKIIEKIGIKWILNYARRLGIFSPLNPDYTLALGSSSVTLYEMTKVFSILGRMGKNIEPLLVKEVTNSDQEELLMSLSLDEYFLDQIQPLKEEMAKRREKFFSEKESNLSEVPDTQLKQPNFFFKDPNQLISQRTAFLMTTLLSAVIKEPYGTGFSAQDLNWPVAGKTGTTNNYYDSWFVGYTTQVATGVWIGFDSEHSLGRGESGAKAALPIWKQFMKDIHKGKQVENFTTPEGIVFTRIDNETGQIVSPQSRQVVVQAFIEGTEPRPDEEEEVTTLEDQDFLREGLSQ